MGFERGNEEEKRKNGQKREKKGGIKIIKEVRENKEESGKF